MFYVYILYILNHVQCYTMIFTHTFVRDNILYIHAALLRGKRLFLDREFSYAARLARTAQSESRQGRQQSSGARARQSETKHPRRVG